MYRSPCAKLSSFSTPYTIENPSATSAYSAPVVTPLTSSWKKKLMRCQIYLSRRPARAGMGQRAPVCDSCSGSARDQVVGALRVDLEEEELAVRQVATGGEADGLTEDGRGLAGRLDGGQHVGAGRRLARLAHRRDGLVHDMRRRVHRRAERAVTDVLGLGRGDDRRVG